MGAEQIAADKKAAEEKAAAEAAAKKAGKPAKAQESAGISKAERDELEKLKLFKQEEEAQYDADAATKHKADVDAQTEKLDVEIAQLTGKDNKKARQEKEKEKKALKDSKEYIDACKV